jgi:hypothetical protein
MSWRVEKGGGTCSADEWAVLKQDDESTAGCHSTRRKAEAQMRALYASEKQSMRELVAAWLCLDGEARAEIVAELGIDPPGGPGNWDEACMKAVREQGKTEALREALHSRTMGGDMVKQTETDYTADPRFEHKTVRAAGVKVLDGEAGILEAFVAGIGNVDAGGDVIEATFFQSSLDKHLRKMPKGVAGHDWLQPVAKTLETRTVKAGSPELPAQIKAAGAGGQYVKAQFNLDTQRGRETFSDVKFFGEEQEFSIGYIAEVAPKDDDGVRHLREGAWYEWSPVLFGMNPVTATVGVKGLAAVMAEITEAVGTEGPVDVERMEAVLRDMGPDKVRRIAESKIVQEFLCGCALEDKAVSEKPWDGAASRFTDEQYKRACAGCRGEDEEHPKSDCYLPHHEPAGAVSRAGVHAAAARFNQTQDVSDAAKGHLAAHYRNDLDEDVPVSLGGEEKAGTKEAVAGSVEERQEAISDAVRAWVAATYPPTPGEPDYGHYGWIVATFADHVIVCVYAEDGERRFLDFPYSIDAVGEATLGDPTEVDLTTVVSPKTLEAALAKAGARHSRTDQENIQAAHDAIVKAGAYCWPKPDEGKMPAWSMTDVAALELLQAELS